MYLWRHPSTRLSYNTKRPKISPPERAWIRGGRHTFGGLLLLLRWVAPATISQKWSWNRRKGRRHATLWSICCLFCFINFFWFICQNFEKNEFPNLWCKFKKWNGRIFFPKPNFLLYNHSFTSKLTKYIFRWEGRSNPPNIYFVNFAVNEWL